MRVARALLEYAERAETLERELADLVQHAEKGMERLATAVARAVALARAAWRAWQANGLFEGLHLLRPPGSSCVGGSDFSFTKPGTTTRLISHKVERLGEILGRAQELA